MDVPDFDIEWRLARRFQNALRLLVTYMEEIPSPRPELSSKLVDLIALLTHPEVTAGASPVAAELGVHLANWIGLILTAHENPEDLDLDDF
jgi:hypothetical protein